LKQLQPLKFETHKLVFAGEISLAKENIKLNQMFDGDDIKIVPNWILH